MSDRAPVELESQREGYSDGASLENGLRSHKKIEGCW